MTVSAENNTLSAKIDTVIDLLTRLVAQNTDLKAQLAANAGATADVADNTAAVVADATRLDPVIQAAQAALG